MKRRQEIVVAFVVIMVIGAVAWTAIPGIVGQTVISVDGYNTDGVYTRIYTGSETPSTHWVVLGTKSPDVRLVMQSGSVRNYLDTPGCAVLRDDAPFTVRVDRRWLGLFYIPQQTLRLAEEALYPVAPNDQVAMQSECQAAVEADGAIVE